MLTVSNITFRIGDLSILDGVTFSVKSGERVGIIGPNGSGKTSLFNCISGFNNCSSGTIRFGSEEITSLAPHRRALLGIGRVFQNFGIFREMTLVENVLLAIESRQKGFVLPGSKRHKRNIQAAKEALALVKLDHRGDEKARSLSGGQMRLLEIGRALAFGAELFLLDEPTAGVSPKMKSEVEGVLRHLQQLGKTVLIIEHDMNFIQRLCDRIIVLDVGRIVLDDSPEKIRSNHMLQEIYFGASGNGTAGNGATA